MRSSPVSRWWPRSRYPASSLRRRRRARAHASWTTAPGDVVLLVGNVAEMQGAPVDHDLAAADAEEAAEIDDGCPHRAGAIDDDVDDMAHVLVSGTAHVAAEHAVRLARRDNGDRRRRRRLLRSREWLGLLCRRGRRRSCNSFSARTATAANTTSRGARMSQRLARICPPFLGAPQRASTIETWICPRRRSTSIDTPSPWRRINRVDARIRRVAGRAARLR